MLQLKQFVLNAWCAAEFGKVLDFRISRKAGTPHAGNNFGQKVVISTLIASTI